MTAFHFPVPSTCCACGSKTSHAVAYDAGIIHLCAACGLQWAEREPCGGKRPDATGMNGRYMDPRSIDAPVYGPFVDFFQRLPRWLGPNPVSILDIGCGNGLFMAEAARRGHHVAGIEMDTDLRAIIPAQVLDRVHFSAAENVLPALHETFDVITLWDSFEHLDDPFAVLDMCRHCLAPNGVVFIRTNNNRDIFNLVSLLALKAGLSGIGQRLLRTCFNLPDHAWNFSPRAMDLLTAKAGWAIADHRPTETPVLRFTTNPLLIVAITVAYGVNRLCGFGKIGEYWVRPKTA